MTVRILLPHSLRPSLPLFLTRRHPSPPPSLAPWLPAFWTRQCQWANLSFLLAGWQTTPDYNSRDLICSSTSPRKRATKLPSLTPHVRPSTFSPVLPFCRLGLCHISRRPPLLVGHLRSSGEPLPHRAETRQLQLHWRRRDPWGDDKSHCPNTQSRQTRLKMWARVVLGRTRLQRPSPPSLRCCSACPGNNCSTLCWSSAPLAENKRTQSWGMEITCPHLSKAEGSYIHLKVVVTSLQYIQ